MIVFHGKNLRTSERGVALVVALLMLMLISAALMGMIMMSNTETNISANFRDEQTAFFSSRGALKKCATACAPALRTAWAAALFSVPPMFLRSRYPAWPTVFFTLPTLRQERPLLPGSLWAPPLLIRIRKSARKSFV